MKKNKFIIKKRIKKKVTHESSSIKLNTKTNSGLDYVGKSLVEQRRSQRKNINKKLELLNRKKDFDIIVFISSYNRYDKIKRLLKQLYEQETKYTFKIFLLNDGSDDAIYDELQKEYENIIYLKNNVNFGKKKYWMSINKIFNEIIKYKSDIVIQIDDDFILKDNFLDNLYDEYINKLKNNKNVVAIYYHRFIGDINRRWGLGDNWFDGGFCIDYNFLIDIDFRIDPIGLNRWKKNPNLSSGVWAQISKKINDKRKKIHKTNISFVEHDGNDLSVMNEELRLTKKIISL